MLYSRYLIAKKEEIDRKSMCNDSNQGKLYTLMKLCDDAC